MQHLGPDWGTRRAAWCAIDDHRAVHEGAIPADQDGLSRLALALDAHDPSGCIEIMSGAVWVRDRLAKIGWDVRSADAREVTAIAPLPCKTLFEREWRPHAPRAQRTSGVVACGCYRPFTSSA
jgi:hypothetical protein